MQDAYLIAYLVERGINAAIAGNVFYGYVLFTNLADGAFIVRLDAVLYCLHVDVHATCHCNWLLF